MRNVNPFTPASSALLMDPSLTELLQPYYRESIKRDTEDRLRQSIPLTLLTPAAGNEVSLTTSLATLDTLPCNC